jgi:hypothetical protein
LDAATNNNVLLSDGAGNIVFRANGVGGKNTLIGNNAGLSLYSVAAFGWLNGGSGYVSGTYNGVTMSLSSGTAMTIYPTANITVTAGVVTSVTLVTGGAGPGSLVVGNTYLTVTAAQLGGTGSGFSILILSLSTPTNCTYLGSYTGSSDSATSNNVVLSDGAGNVVFKAIGTSQAYSANTTWTPADASGATLTFTSITATYGRLSNRINFTMNLTYPTTASGASAVISGLPVAAFGITTVSGIAYGLGAIVGKINASGTSLTLYSAATGNVITNSSLSGLTITISGSYNS